MKIKFRGIKKQDFQEIENVPFPGEDELDGNEIIAISVNQLGTILKYQNVLQSIYSNFQSMIVR